MGIADLLVFVCGCAGISQDAPLTADQIRAAMQADMRGQRELFEASPPGWPPMAPEESGVTSAARLSHKVPKAAKKSFERATKLAKAGNTAEAIGAYEEAIRLDPDFAAAHNNLGAHYYFTHRLEDAERVLRRAIQLDPAYMEAYSNLGVVYLARGNLEEAKQLARRALALAPRDEVAWSLLNAAQQRSK